jgi:hypothetical protein
MTYLPSPSEIAPAGHASAQAPHWMHASLIAYAIAVTSCYKIVYGVFSGADPLLNLLYHIFGKNQVVLQKNIGITFLTAIFDTVLSILHRIIRFESRQF